MLARKYQPVECVSVSLRRTVEQQRPNWNAILITLRGELVLNRGLLITSYLSE